MRSNLTKLWSYSLKTATAERGFPVGPGNGNSHPGRLSPQVDKIARRLHLVARITWKASTASWRFPAGWQPSKKCRSAPTRLKNDPLYLKSMEDFLCLSIWQVPKGGQCLMSKILKDDSKKGECRSMRHPLLLYSCKIIPYRSPSS